MLWKFNSNKGRPGSFAGFCWRAVRSPGVRDPNKPDWRLYSDYAPCSAKTHRSFSSGGDGLRAWGEALPRLEAALFLARQPLSAKKLAQICGFDSAAEVKGYLRRLNKLYDEVGSPFGVVEVAGGYQLRTRPAFFNWVTRLTGERGVLRLSPPALETLAVIAYRQPVLRAEIEAIRGVQCGEILRQLMDRGLVKIVGRSEDLGRPYLYGTTETFLEVFGLRGLDDLPHAEYRYSAYSQAKGASQQASPPSTEE